MRINNLKAVLVLAASLFSLSFANSVAQGTYAISAGDEFKAGQEITSVPGVTLVMPALAQNDDTETPTGAAQSSANWADIDFVAFTPGNGGNPKLTSGVWHGTTYTFKVAESGTITAGVVLNANKTLVLVKNDTEDVLATATYFLPDALGNASQTLDDNKRVAVKSQGTVTFPVEAGNTYNIHCAGSKMGFYGFKFAKAVESDFLDEELSFENSAILSFNTLGLYGGAGTKANEITGVKGTTAKGFKVKAVNASLELEPAPNLEINGESHKTINLPAGEQVLITLPKGKMATKLSIVAFANVYDSTATMRPTYFSEINGKEYTVETIDTLKSYRKFDRPDTLITACAEVDAITLTGAGEDIAFIAVVEYIDNPYIIVDIEGTELLRNGDFETWNEGVAPFWASVKTTASNGAVLTASEDAYEGSASMLITNDSKNKRLAYRELKLKAGTYYFSFLAKAVKVGQQPQIQYGFVPSVDGKVGNYVYQDTKTVPSANKWTQFIDTLTFENDTTINLLVMSKKSTADVLVDNASLKTKTGGLLNYFETFEYEDNASFFVYEGTKDTIDYTVAPFGGVVATVSSSNAAVSAVANATSIIVSCVAPGQAAITATIEGVTKTIKYTVIELGTGTETEQNVQGAKGEELVGKSYSFEGKAVIGELENGYEVFATNVTAENTLTLNVKKGAVIKSISIQGAANDEGLAESAAPITITGISIDGGANILEPVEVGAKPATVVTNIIGLPTYPEMVNVLDAENVKKNITFTFDNTNVKANKQVVFKYTIVYEFPEIEVTASADTIKVGETLTLSSKVTPKSYLDRGYSVVYTIDSDTVVALDAEGKLVGVGVGSAVVTASLTNGEEPVATAKVTVTVEAAPEPVVPETPEVETAWKELGVVDFEDATTYLDGWTFSGKSAPAQVETADGKHYFSNYASGGAGYMTYTVANSKYLAADEWKVVFEYNLYTSNSKESRLDVKGVKNDLIFYATNPSWSTDDVTVFDAAGNQIGTFKGVYQNKSTRGKNDCVAPAHVVTLVGSAEGIYLTVTALDGTEEIAKVKVQEFDHVGSIYQVLGNQLSAAAFNDIAFYQAGEAVSSQTLVVDFEDETTYLDGWTFTGKSAPAQVETADGKHYLSNYASGGAGYMTYNVANAKFLAAEGWNLDFEYNLYTSNSKESRLEVKGVKNDVIFYATNPSWSTDDVTVFDAAGNQIGTFKGVYQNKNTRGKNDCVAPAHKISLRGQADGIYLTVTALDGTEEIAKVKVQEFDNVSAIYQVLGSQLSAAAFNDMIFAIDDVATWGDAFVADFEDEASYLDGWTFTGKSAPAQVETADGKHYLSNYASGGAGYMTYTINNTQFAKADKWTLTFEYNLYTSNSKESRLDVKGVKNDLIFYATNPSWSTDDVTVFDAAGNQIGTFKGVYQNKSTRGKNDCVAPAHKILLEGTPEGVFLTITALDGTEEIAKVKVQEFDHVASIYQVLGNQLSAAAFNDIVGRVLAAGESLDLPKFIVTGNAASSNLVEISTPNAGATIFYTLDGGEATLYTEGIRVFQDAEFTAWTTKVTDSGEEIKSDVAKKSVEAGHVPAPKAEVIAVNGAERTIKLADDSVRTVITYGIGTEPATTYTEPFATSAGDSIYMKAALQDLYTETVFYSEVANAGVLAGSWIQLNPVVFTPVNWYAKQTPADTLIGDDYASKGLVAYVVTTDTASILCKPSAKIDLIYVTSDHKDTTILGTYKSGDTLYHIPYGGVFARDYADGYLDNEGHIFNRPAPTLEVVWSIEFDTLNNRGKNATDFVMQTDKGFAAPEASGTINGVDATIGAATVYPVVATDSVLNENFGVNSGDLRLRVKEGQYNGLYNFGSGQRIMGFKNLEQNQIIRLIANGNVQNLHYSANLSYEAAMSDPVSGVFYFRMNEDGVASISYPRNGDPAQGAAYGGWIDYKSVAVLNSSDNLMKPSFFIDHVEGLTHYVGITGPEYSDLYYSFVTNDSLNANYEYVNTQYDTLGFNTSIGSAIYDHGNLVEVLSYDTTWVVNATRQYWTPYVKYTEPIAITDTTVFRAYAWFQDMQSRAAIDTMAAGTPVRLARPVITFVGETDTTDLYKITVDNSNVISTPDCRIYVGWATYADIANGDTVAIKKTAVDGNYGWIYAQAYAPGYNSSAPAFRYLDARTSHNETYTGFYYDYGYGVDTIMPEATADFEISPYARFTSTTLRTTGNVYYHKQVEPGFNAIVLPFVPAYVTDAAGNVLTNGVDYKIYNYTSKGNGNASSDADLATLLNGDLEYYRRSNNMIAYTGNYLFYSEEWREVIFVSSKGVQFRANNTISMTERSEGWQIVANNTFKDQVATTAFYEVVAQPAGMKGSALVRREAGWWIEPFTSVVLMDTTFMNAKDEDGNYLNDTIALEYAHKAAAIDIESATLTDGGVEVAFTALPVVYDVQSESYVEITTMDLDLTYTVTMYNADGEEIGSAKAKSVAGAYNNYAATVTGANAGDVVTIEITTTIPGNAVLTVTLQKDATGIETLTDDAVANDGAIYNLNGIRVEKQNAKGGIYIQSGKKLQLK